MSTDADDLQHELYQLADAAGDGQVTTAQVEALLARMQGAQPAAQQPGTQHQAPGFGPGGSTALAPEATPFPELDPFPIGQLGERVDQVGRQVALMGEQDRQDALYSFVDQLNRSLDEAARVQAPHHYPKPPAATDEELASLGSEITQAWLEGSTDEDATRALADRFNRTLDGIASDHERQADDFEARRLAAERQRHAKAVTQDDTAKTLRALAGRLDGAAAPGR